MRTRRVWYLVGVAVVLSCAVVRAQEETDQQASFAIAVLPFDDGAVRVEWGGYWTGDVEWGVGPGVADMIATGLVEQAKEGGRFRIMERQRVKEVMAEQDLGESGRVDPATAARVGRLLGAQALLMGSVTEFAVDMDTMDLPYEFGGFGGDRATARAGIDGRLVDSETGEVIAALTGSGKKRQYGVRFNRGDFAGLEVGSARFERTILGKATRQAVDEMVRLVSEDLLDHRHARELLVKKTGLVVHVDGDEVMTNLGLRNGVREGDIFTVVRQREVICDPETNEVLKVIEDEIGTLTVRTVEEKVSTGRIEPALGATVQVKDGVRLVGERPAREERRRRERDSEEG